MADLVAIQNSYPGTCAICKQRVESMAGAAAKSGTGKWQTFHLGCLPDEYGQVKPHRPGPRRFTRTQANMPSLQPPVAATIAQANAGLVSSTAALAAVGSPITPLAPTIVVFYGPIKSSTDGQEHFISGATVIDLHGIGDYRSADVHIVYVSPEKKRTFKFPAGDSFVIGPHYYTSEYEQAGEALRKWLEEKGVKA